MTFDPARPHKLPSLAIPLELTPTSVATHLLPARVALAELKGYSDMLPNPMLLLSPAILRESLASSEIEDIHTTLIDALQNDLFPEAEQRESDKEVLRYRDAMLGGFRLLGELPISSRLITSIHSSLLPQLQGEYRRIQNTIANTATEEVLYTPPVCTEIPGLIQDLETFVNSEEGPDPLVKAAMAHYQFEAIHPFIDGNGRCGRILMVLQLVQAGMLKWPVLYISGYINENRSDYYRLLRQVTVRKDWEPYIDFMLDGFAKQAVETRAMISAILEHFNEWRDVLQREHARIYSYELLQALFAHPITTPVQLASQLGIHYTTASRYLKRLATAGLLTAKAHGKFRLFINYSLLGRMGCGGEPEVDGS